MFIERKNWSLHVFTLFSPGSKKFLKSVTDLSESGPGTVQLKGDFRSDVDVNLQGFQFSTPPMIPVPYEHNNCMDYWSWCQPEVSPILWLNFSDPREYPDLNSSEFGIPETFKYYFEMSVLWKRVE